MNTTKRLSTVTAILMTGALLLSACGNNNNNEANSASPSVAPSASAEASIEASATPEEISGKVTYAQWGTNVETEQTKELLKEFSKKYPKIEVEVVSKDWGTYWTSLTAQAASKDLPDVYKISFAYVDKYAKLAP